MDEILKYDHSNKSYCAVFQFGFNDILSFLVTLVLVKTASMMDDYFSLLSRSPQRCQQDCHCGISGGYGSVSCSSYWSIPLLQTKAVNRPPANTGGSDRYPG